MSLNKTAIEWCDYTWNPVTGCNHGCSYCYARKIAERFKGTKAWPKGFEPTFHNERLKEPNGLGKQYYCPEVWAKKYSVFVCSMADLFGSWVPNAWINTVFMSMLNAERHTYLLLTKNPNRAAHQLTDNFYQFGEMLIPSKIPQNWWIGASVESTRYTGRIDDLRSVPTENRFVSFEPLLGNITSEEFPLDLQGIKQVIIGAQTNPTIKPNLDWIITIEKEADRVGAKVFCKDSLSYLQIEETPNLFRRQLCWQVHK